MKLVKHSKQSVEPWAPVSRAWRPLWPFERLQGDIERMFEKPFGSWFAPLGEFFESWVPTLDVYEDKENVFVKLELPGMKREEIEVAMNGELLNISGERKNEMEAKGAKPYRTERYFGRFHRSIALPSAVDAKKIEAHYLDGILTVTCPKTEEAKQKEIEIKVE